MYYIYSCLSSIPEPSDVLPSPEDYVFAYGHEDDSCNDESYGWFAYLKDCNDIPFYGFYGSYFTCDPLNGVTLYKCDDLECSSDWYKSTFILLIQHSDEFQFIQIGCVYISTLGVQAYVFLSLYF